MWIKEYDNGQEVLINLDLVRALTKTDLEVKEEEGSEPKLLVYDERGERAKKMQHVIIFINFEKDPTFLTYTNVEERDRVWERLSMLLVDHWSV